MPRLRISPLLWGIATVLSIMACAPGLHEHFQVTHLSVEAANWRSPPDSVWQQKLRSPVRHMLYLGAAQMLVISDHGEFYSLDLGNGERSSRIWQPVREPTDPVLLDRENGILYFSSLTDRKTFAMDLQADEILWVQKLDELQGKMILTKDGLHVVQGKRTILSLDPESGEQTRQITLRESVASGLHVLGNEVFLITENGMLQIYSTSLQPLLNLDIGTTPRPDVQTTDTGLLVVDAAGHLRLFDSRTRSMTLKMDMVAEFFTPPLIRDSLLITAQAHGAVRCIQLPEAEELWDYRMEGLVNQPLTIRDDVVLVPNSRGFIIGLDLDSGKELWRLPLHGVIDKLSYLADGLLVVDDRRNMRFFRIPQ